MWGVSSLRCTQASPVVAVGLSWPVACEDVSSSTRFPRDLRNNDLSDHFIAWETPKAQCLRRQYRTDEFGFNERSRGDTHSQETRGQSRKETLKTAWLYLEGETLTLNFSWITT